MEMAESIKARKAKLDKRSKELDRQRDLLSLEYKHLTQDCEHPRKHNTSCMGDPGAYCPDCGKSW